MLNLLLLHLKKKTSSENKTCKAIFVFISQKKNKHQNKTRFFFRIFPWHLIFCHGTLTFLFYLFLLSFFFLLNELTEFFVLSRKRKLFYGLTGFLFKKTLSAFLIYRMMIDWIILYFYFGNKINHKGLFYKIINKD